MKTQRELDCLKTQIVAACRTRQEEGWKLIRNGFRRDRDAPAPGVRCCCPIAAVAGPEQRDGWVKPAAEALSLQRHEVMMLIWGIDGAPEAVRKGDLDDAQLFDLGADIARELELS